MTRRLVTLLALALSAGPAAASCYDVFGCSDQNVFRLKDLLDGPNCEFLYEMRNGIFAEHGYCFSSERGIATFGNDNCRSSNVDALGLNRTERTNVSTIAEAERLKGCR